MNNAELSKKIEGYLKPAASKAKKFEDLVAVTVSLISENNEDLYVEVKDGKITVAPYSYNDFGCAVEAAPESIDRIFSGEISFDKALSDGLVKICGGDVAKFKALEVLVPSKKAAVKAPAKKACGKACAPKAAAKAADKAPVAAKTVTEKAPAAAKAVAEKAPAAKPVAEKAPVAAKPVEKAPAKKAAKKK